MGIFKRSNKSSVGNIFDFLNPDGSRPDTSSRGAIATAIKGLAITSPNHQLHEIDTDSWIKASVILETSGFRFHEGKPSLGIAAAPVMGRGLDEDRSEVDALAILTLDFLSIHWSHFGQKRAWKFLHRDILGVELDGPTTALFHYENSWRGTGDEILNTGDWTFEITLLPSRDGHDNRRSLTFWMTLAQEISKKFPGFEFIELG
jgi:hypothetical protein